MSKSLVYIGIGSNLDPLTNLRLALRSLKNKFPQQVICVSSIYESEALLPDGAPSDWNKPYLNAVVQLEINDFNPEKTLALLKLIESSLKREQNQRWAPRTIDLDLIYVEGVKYHSKVLQIPHSQYLQRPFVVLPLLELDPHFFRRSNEIAPAWVMTPDRVPFFTQKSKKYFWPQVVGILNLTEDSFSDGGQFLVNNELQSEKIFQTIDQQLQQGADIIDIGAESTRPGSQAVSDDQQNHRILSVLKIIQQQKSFFSKNFLVSLDCRSPSVIKNILKNFSIDFINDVEGFQRNDMLDVLKESTAKAVCMHSLTIPPSSDAVLATDESIFLNLQQWWEQKINFFADHGFAPERLIFDPGIGFGKTAQQNRFILQNLEYFNHLPRMSNEVNDIFIGHSRKSFLNLWTSKSAMNRDLETALMTAKLNLAYVQYLRVHDVASQLQALKI